MNTKIIATIGPKTESPEDLKRLLDEGVEMIRINFSHASYEQYVRVKKILDFYNKKNKKQVKIMLDLQGPRIRVGNMPDGGINLEEGERYSFIFKKGGTYQKGIIPIDNSELHLDIKKGEPLYLANGEIELIVNEIKKGFIKGTVVRGGLLTSHKGINVPYTNMKRGGLMPKDIRDVKFGLKTGVDYVALSFVQTRDDVEKLRKLISKKKGVQLISKIERAIALRNIDQIIQASDAIMIARGDLGIEIPIEELPIVQKYLVKFAHWHDKPAIIATQIMTSMIKNSHPTRAEISDIANAVLDGGDMVMLSDETTIGDHPFIAVRTLKKVVNRTERYLDKENLKI
ncbi:pyruvate kinase [Candidatus Falkowbacteria bacterium]|nr:pyruvate kinase [Candidatus Falkowbacteria bacterium]NCT54663.1 pyruvate kinase [Candidatus Falkowbacteria bacterium]